MFQELMVSLSVSTACKDLKLLIKFEHNLYSTDNIELPSITIQITFKKSSVNNYSHLTLFIPYEHF